MVSSIPARQNEPEALRLIGVARRLYGHAKWVMSIQVVVVVLLPLGLLILEQVSPRTKALVAALSLGIAILDAALLDRLKSSLQQQAASVQELFDTRLFELPWPSLRSDRPDKEDLERHSRRLDTGGLLDWYPPEVASLRADAAVVLCQRSNCRWDAHLRRSFRATLIVLAVVLIVGVAVVALARNPTFEDVVLTLLAPIVPVVLWAIREAREQREAASRADRLKSFGDDLWRRLLTERSFLERQDLRRFQDAILDHRQQSPMVFDWFYWFLRKSSEAQMHYSAKEMVQEATQAGLN